MSNSDTNTTFDAADLNLLRQDLQECAEVWQYGDVDDLVIDLDFPNLPPGNCPDALVIEHVKASLGLFVGARIVCWLREHPGAAVRRCTVRLVVECD